MLNKRCQLFLIITVALFCNFSCTLSSAQKNVTQAENLKIASNTETFKSNQRTVTDSERMTASNGAAVKKQTSQAEPNDCSRNVKGASDRKIEIPSELCFDEMKPADKSEVVKDPPKGVKQANTLLSDKIPTGEVPTEVLRVIELITGSNPTVKKFSLIVSSNGQDSTTPKRTIKMYLYSPITNDSKDGGTFYFQKQNGKLKLVLAEVTK